MGHGDANPGGHAEPRPLLPWIIAALVGASASVRFAPMLLNYLRSTPPVSTVVATQPQERSTRVNLDAELTGDAAPVLVRFSLDNSYPDAEAPLREAALQVLPGRDVAIAQPISIPDLIRQQFAVTNDQQPAAYAQIQADLRRRSEIVNGLVTIARVPQLPPFTSQRNNLSAFISLQAGRNTSQAVLPVLPNGRPFRPGVIAPPALTTYTVSGTEADLKQGALRALAHSVRGEILAKEIEIQLAADTPAARPSYPTYVLDQAATIQRIVASGSHRVRLYVLDTGWPDDQARKDSVAALSELCAKAREWYRFPAGGGGLANTYTPFPAPSDPHVVNVQTSIRQATTTPNRVDTIYVPMTLDQESKPLLEEIVTLGLAIKKWGKPDIQPEIHDGPKEFANVTADEISNAMKTFSRQSDQGKFHVSSALLTGFFLIAAREAARTEDGYFVNESWTTVDADILLSPVEAPRGYVVAAVGNDAPRNISSARVAFASFARQHKNILAVLTMNDKGTTDCKSSTVSFAPWDVGAVGYYGQISGEACYSSFAAPRVAWFLAARDTLRSSAIASPDDWVDDIRTRINNLRAPSDPIPQSFLFNPIKYLQ